MKFKRGIDASSVHPRLWQLLEWLDQLHLEWTEEALTVTSLRRDYDPEKRTKHQTAFLDPTIDPRSEDATSYLSTAADLRRWALDETKKTLEFCRHIQAMYGEQVGVMLEPEWLSAAALKRRYPVLFQMVRPSYAAVEEARERVAPHVHVQLKKPIRWTAFV